MLNVRLAGDHLYGKLLLNLAVACDVYDGVFFVLSFFPRDVLDEILNLFESVSEGFPSYSCSFLWCDAFVVIVLSDEPRQNQGRGLVDRKLVKAPPPPPSNFIAGRPKAALLFWFFGGVPSLSLFLLYINIKIGKNRCVCMRTAVHLAVACGVFDGVFLCCPFSH